MFELKNRVGNPRRKGMQDQAEDFRWAMVLACEEAAKSPIKTTQNGAVVVDRNYNVIATGFNYPINEEGDVHVHAEEEAIAEFMMRRRHLSSPENTDFILVCPWAACVDCAKAIYLAGIKDVVVLEAAMAREHPAWQDTILKALSVLKENGIRVHVMRGDVPRPKLRFRGELW